MNRIIKYRVWDTRQNKYLHPDTVSISGSGVMSFAGTGGKYHTITQPSDDPSPRFIIEQDTGLKDKNGNEIYEGDIVRHMGGGGYMRVSQVKFDRGCYNVGTHSGSSTAKKPMLLNGRMTILGNVHHNPELLEAK